MESCFGSQIRNVRKETIPSLPLPKQSFIEQLLPAPDEDIAVP
jgi:hypothetical protein